MGSCVSSSGSSPSPASSVHSLPTANIIIDGRLRQYALPATASQVLTIETSSSPTPNKDQISHFLCNSDALRFDGYIPALEPHHQLHPHQIYFMLPLANLRHRLSASDMAALAVKAATALPQQPANKRKNKSRISPSVQRVNEAVIQAGSEKKASAGGISRSPSLRAKLHKFSAKRARLAVRSFRLRLSTIHEGAVLDTLGGSSRHRHLPGFHWDF